MRVVVVGPVSPCRGGISYYTTELCRLLAKKHRVVAYSMERLYTSLLFRLLFRGNNVFDSSKQVVDSGVETKRIISVNPFSWLKAAVKIRRLKPDVVIVTWIEPYMAPLAKTLEWFLPKSARLVFICHNVLPHEPRLFSRQLAGLSFKNVDGFITHAESETKRLLELCPGASYVQAYLPAYTLVSGGGSIRKELGLRGNVLLFFGYVRPYKGLRYLLKALPIVLEKVDLDLLVVGEFWEDKGEYLDIIRVLGVEDRVKIVDRYVPNEDIGRYFADADVAVLPYESGSQSAVVQVAYAHDTPVIASRTGGLADNVVDGKTGFLVEPKNEKALADAIIRFYIQKKRKEFVKNIKKIRQKFSWAEYMRRLESLF
ncbi:MAG: glycosyltransferase family 4 protein [Candidatus Woesearchaeota archaeon]